MNVARKGIEKTYKKKNPRRNVDLAAYQKPDCVGGSERDEMHHVDAIGMVDGVYALDNIRIMTPKRHIEIHQGDK